jgi:hypothetical protein
MRGHDIPAQLAGELALQPYSPQQKESRASETEATSDERHKLDKVVLNRLRNR